MEVDLRPLYWAGAAALGTAAIGGFIVGLMAEGPALYVAGTVIVLFLLALAWKGREL